MGDVQVVRVGAPAARIVLRGRAPTGSLIGSSAGPGRFRVMVPLCDGRSRNAAGAAADWLTDPGSVSILSDIKSDKQN
jgi:hypothetical protein